MSLKKTDLAKNQALKLANALRQEHSSRFGKNALDAPLDRREQRKLDQAKGLVPFACKLDARLATALRERAASHPQGMTGLLDELLRAGLGLTATDCSTS